MFNMRNSRVAAKDLHQRELVLRKVSWDLDWRLGNIVSSIFAAAVIKFLQKCLIIYVINPSVMDIVYIIGLLAGNFKYWKEMYIHYPIEYLPFDDHSWMVSQGVQECSTFKQPT